MGVIVRVGMNEAVAELNRPACVGGHVGLVRDHGDSEMAVSVEAAEQFHDLLASCTIQVAGGLIGKQNRGLRDHGARDGHALLLAT
jgi:hypothetical protein